MKKNALWKCNTSVSLLALCVIIYMPYNMYKISSEHTPGIKPEGFPAMLDSWVSSGGRFEQKQQPVSHCSERHKHTLSQQLQEQILGRIMES